MHIAASQPVTHTKFVKIIENSKLITGNLQRRSINAAIRRDNYPEHHCRMSRNMSIFASRTPTRFSPPPVFSLCPCCLPPKRKKYRKATLRIPTSCSSCVTTWDMATWPVMDSRTYPPPTSTAWHKKACASHKPMQAHLFLLHRVRPS